MRTLFNPNASRFGKYTEIQFSDRGRLQGIKTLDYYLERNRVAGAPNGERNFHIFYYLVAGATPEERQHLHLLDKTTYRYLSQHRAPNAPNACPTDDAMRFDQLKVALKTIGLSKRHVAQTCQLVAAILHLGNLEFTIDRHRNEDAAVVRNTDVCEIVANLFLQADDEARAGRVCGVPQFARVNLQPHARSLMAGGGDTNGEKNIYPHGQPQVNLRT